MATALPPQGSTATATDEGPASGVHAHGLAFRYPGRVLWENLDMDAAPGEFVALLGESGSGKTTLLSCLASFEKPAEGRLDVFGVQPAELRGRHLREYRRRTVGFAFQNAGVVASWTVRQNLEVGGVRVDASSAEVQEAFDAFALDIARLESPVHQLSGGEQQRVGLIRLALRKTPLLLMDEPTAALDDGNTARVVTFIDRHRSRGGVAIVATHDARLIGHADNTLHL